jgi:hypothetical protein
MGGDFGPFARPRFERQLQNFSGFFLPKSHAKTKKFGTFLLTEL